MSQAKPIVLNPDYKREPAGSRLLRIASELFYWRGIRAVGVDEIVKIAGVAKISLYRAFASKDALIVAYLKERDSAFWSGWDTAVADVNGPEDELRAMLAFLSRAISAPGYRGCPFANFTSEYPEREHDGRLIVEASRGELRKRLTNICCRLTVNDHRRLADSLFLLIEGSFTASQTVRDGGQFASSALEWATEAILAAEKRSVDGNAATYCGLRRSTASTRAD